MAGKQFPYPDAWYRNNNKNEAGEPAPLDVSCVLFEPGQVRFLTAPERHKGQGPVQRALDNGRLLGPFETEDHAHGNVKNQPPESILKAQAVKAAEAQAAAEKETEASSEQVIEESSTPTAPTAPEAAAGSEDMPPVPLTVEKAIEAAGTDDSKTIVVASDGSATLEAHAAVSDVGALSTSAFDDETPTPVPAPAPVKAEKPSQSSSGKKKNK